MAEGEHICRYGIGFYTLPFMPLNYHETCKAPESKEVELCKKWITENCKKIKTISRYGSYHLKHVVEYAIGEYVSNGAFIKAALELGYTIDAYSPNAYFNMTSIDRKRPLNLKRYD